MLCIKSPKSGAYTCSLDLQPIQICRFQKTLSHLSNNGGVCASGNILPKWRLRDITTT